MSSIIVWKWLQGRSTQIPLVLEVPGDYKTLTYNMVPVILLKLMEERTSMPPQRSKVTLRVPDVSGSLDRNDSFKRTEESWG